jgi:protein TonB
LAPGPSGPTAPPELVHKVDPVYPTAAKTVNEASIVSLDLKVDSAGRIGTIKVVSGNNPFVSSALNAVRQWRYEPAVQNGKKIESMVRVDIAFNPR